MASKPAEDVAKPEAKPELPNIEETKVSAEEREEKNKIEGLEEIEVKPAEAAKPTKQVSSDDYTIENPGMLYAQWSSTVLIRRETLSGWGKVKEVDIETPKGKKVTCKVYPVDGLEIGVVQIPDKMQLKLGVGKGGTVKVKPAF